MNTPSIYMRICAKITDYCLFFGVGLIASLTLPYEASRLFYLGLGLSTPLLFIPFEACLLSSWGTTPGKALLGIIARTSEGKKLSFKEAWKGYSLLQKKPGVLRQICSYAIAASLLLFTVMSKTITDSNIGAEKQQKITGWVQYSSKKAGFHVHFPNDPQIEEKEVALPSAKDPVNYNEYKSEGKSQVSYAVSYIDTPRKWGFVSSKRILKGVLDVIMKLEPGSELIAKEFATHNEQYPAMNFHYKKGEDEVLGRLIRIGHRLYKLTITYPSAKAEQQFVSHEFLDSFGLATEEISVN